MAKRQTAVLPDLFWKPPQKKFLIKNSASLTIVSSGELLGMPGIEPWSAGSRNKNANHCVIPCLHLMDLQETLGSRVYYQTRNSLKNFNRLFFSLYWNRLDRKDATQKKSCKKRKKRIKGVNWKEVAPSFLSCVWLNLVPLPQWLQSLIDI